MKHRNTLRINPDDFATLSICAIRYCQGRQTYMPKTVRGIVREHLGELSSKDIHIMLDDCRLQEEYNLLGDEVIDKPGWLKWKEDLLKEKERRNDN